MPASGWQVVQEADGLSLWLAGAMSDVADTALVESLTTALAAQGVRSLPIRIKHVATIPKTAAGKAPLVRAYVPPNSTLEESR